VLDISQKHEKILYPIVRVRTEKAGGSGTIIYSQLGREEKSNQRYQTFVLTNSHVIEGAISTKEEWDSLIKKKVEKEILEKVIVETFDYVDLSKVVSSNSHKADIVAYDKSHDLAILMLDSPKELPNVAPIIPQKDIEELKLFTKVYACGCSLLHDPFANPGEITYLKEIIENKEYIMSNNNSIFGNSGGALFREDGVLIGVTSRITGVQIGYGHDIMTWMGFSCHPCRIYQFLKEQELRFIYDEKDSYEKATKRRKKKQKEHLLAYLREREKPQTSDDAVEIVKG
jgi:S1-C subfamily serine protease